MWSYYDDDWHDEPSIMYNWHGSTSKAHRVGFEGIACIHIWISLWNAVTGYDSIVWALYLCLALTSAFFSMRNLSMRLNVSNVCDLPIIYFGCVCHHEWAFVCFCGCSDICIRLVLLVLLFGRTYERSGLFGIWYYYYAKSFRLLRHAWNWSGDGSTDGLTGCQSDYARWV